MPGLMAQVDKMGKSTQQRWHEWTADTESANPRRSHKGQGQERVHGEAESPTGYQRGGRVDQRSPPMLRLRNLGRPSAESRRGREREAGEGARVEWLQRTSEDATGTSQAVGQASRYPSEVSPGPRGEKVSRWSVTLLSPHPPS